MEKMELSEALKANASVLEGLLGVSSSTRSELDGLLWNNTSPGSIYTFNSTSDYDSKKHPFGAAGTVEVKRFGGSSTIQILYDINNHVFLRRKVGEEAWNAWTQV
jgi:hypothetical protein